MLVFSNHALKRMAERKITSASVSQTVDNPDKVYNDNGEYRAVKLFGNKVVVVIYTVSDGVKFIITLWESDKIYKYLPKD